MSRRRRAELLARRGAVALAGPHSARRASGQSQPGRGDWNHQLQQFRSASDFALTCLALVTAKCPRYIRRQVSRRRIECYRKRRPWKMVELDQALKSQNGEQVLRSIEEWMVQQGHAAKTTKQATDIDNHASGNGSHITPSIAPPELSIEASSSASPERPIDPSPHAKIPPIASKRPFIGKRLVRPVVGGLLIAIFVAVAWQTYRDNQTRKLVGAWGHSFGIWLSSGLGASERVSESTAQPSAKLSDQTSTPAVTSRSANELAELQQQLQIVVNDLAVLRRNVEQLSNKHEQMSRDIATVQATEQNISEKISSFTQPASVPAPAPPRKKIPRLARAETPRQPAAVSLPPQTSAAGTASPTEQPPRPPLPLPTPAETSSPVH